MAASDIIAEWLVATFSADPVTVANLAKRPDAPTAPGLYEGLKATGAAYPHIVWAMLANTSSQIVGGVEVVSVSTVQVRVTDTAASYGGRLETVLGRIKALLHRRANVVTMRGAVVACTVGPEYKMTEIDNGVQYRHRGYAFTIITQEAP